MLAGSTTRILFAIKPKPNQNQNPISRLTKNNMFTLATRSITSSKKRESVLIDDNVSLYQNVSTPLPPPLPSTHSPHDHSPHDHYLSNQCLKNDGTTMTTTRILNDKEELQIQPQTIVDINNHHNSNHNRSKLIGSTIYNHIKSIDPETCHEDALDPFYICDLNKLTHLLKLWHLKLPRVEPLYAMKCNKNPILLRKMVSLGLGFDCASKNEIEMMLNLGVTPNKIIYANPYLKISSSLWHPN
ncbi:unnamed protein product [Ambrosiozyma monospora]|uniref:ornithine decarboxylase n=1 Tax=Ambrosiozyma monospora TaxID=43982 RepID=A0A9W7DJ75_AMBMO|nr:unnamed protein product [Ambrosiozyma monospora]